MSVEIANRNNWGPGTRLRGLLRHDDSSWWEETVIEIVFVGSRVLLTNVIARRSRDEPEWRPGLPWQQEGAWDLDCREWKTLTEWSSFALTEWTNTVTGSR